MGKGEKKPELPPEAEHWPTEVKEWFLKRMAGIRAISAQRLNRLYARNRKRGNVRYK